MRTMKKISAFILALMLLSLCACGNSSATATVVTNSGTTEKLTVKDLEKIEDENDVAFEDEYLCAKVTVSGKVTSVQSSHFYNGMHCSWAVYVDGWRFAKGTYTKSDVTSDFLASLKEGDLVTASGELCSPGDVCNGTIQIVKN